MQATHGEGTTNREGEGLGEEGEWIEEDLEALVEMYVMCVDRRVTRHEFAGHCGHSLKIQVLAHTTDHLRGDGVPKGVGPGVGPVAMAGGHLDSTTSRNQI